MARPGGRPRRESRDAPQVRPAGALAALLAATLIAGSAPAAWATDLAVNRPASRSPVSADDFGDKLMVLGTGPLGGAFRPIGEALCEAANTERARTAVRCVAQPSAGSVFNLHAVINGNLQLGLAQEDLMVRLRADRRLPQAQRLRVLALLHDSPIVVMAHRDAGIRSLADLRGKTFNIGNQGSGQATIASALMRAAGLETEDLAKATTLPTQSLARAFCERKVDAMVEAVAHPALLYTEMRACGGEFVGLDEALAQRLRADNALLTPMTLPPDTYAGQTSAVQTLGMRNVLVARDDLDPQAVARLLHAIGRNLPAVREMNPMMRGLPEPDSARLASVPAPAHAGALQAWQAKDTR